MKPNTRLRLEQGLFIVAILVVVGLLFRRRRVELLEGGELKKSEAMLYLENSDEPNPFILYGMVKKQTDDEEKQKKALTLATQKKYGELKEFLATI
jgi:hypothetical protein